MDHYSIAAPWALTSGRPLHAHAGLADTANELFYVDDVDNTFDSHRKLQASGANFESSGRHGNLPSSSR